MYQDMYERMYENAYENVYVKKKKKFIPFFLIIFVLILIYIFWLVFWHSSTNEKTIAKTDDSEITTSDMQNEQQNEQQKIVVDLTPESSNENQASDNVLQQLIGKISYIEIGDLELPVDGATGFASVFMQLKNSPYQDAQMVKQLSPGTAFKIVSEQDNWWKIEVDSTVGWVESKYCMINLPDVIPSIIYDNTNSYSSLFMSSGYDIPDITGKALYNTKKANKRLGKDEFVMPVIYGMAKRICSAQQLALKEGNCLKIYETFRPYATQMSVAKSLNNLINANSVVNAGINSFNWNQSWFIAQNLSNHQRGVAIDVSLVRIIDYRTKSTGEYSYTYITNYEEYKMPTQMHELSTAAATFKYPVSPASTTSWQNVPMSDTMNDNAIKLQNYCTSAGLSPLASEWWHFNDLETKQSINDNLSNGQYFITECFSDIPTNSYR